MNSPNWLGLLKWSLSYSDGTTNNKIIKEISKEDKEWLELVMKEIVKDEGNILCNILKRFQDYINNNNNSSESSNNSSENNNNNNSENNNNNNSNINNNNNSNNNNNNNNSNNNNNNNNDNNSLNEDEMKDMLIEVQSIIDQIDMANIFVKFGGIKVLKYILFNNSLSNEIKALSCIIVGELAQNNPNVQDQMYQQGLLDDLCIITVSSETSKLCVKSLYGLSCIVRGHKLSEERFFNELNGPFLLQRLFQRNDSNCNVKLLFFLSALLTSDFINYSTLSTYCDILLENYCFPLIVPTTQPESEMAINVIQSLTLSLTGQQYLKLNQSKILQLLDEKYFQIVEEHKKLRENSNISEQDIDKTPLTTITEIIEFIKNNQVNEYQDSTQSNNQQHHHHHQQQHENQNQSNETVLRLCG